MNYWIVGLVFALVGVAGWGFWNQWLVKQVLVDQKRVMSAHSDDMLIFFERQVTEAIRALLWQASGQKFFLENLPKRLNYAVFRNRGGRNKQVMRFCFRPDLSVLVSFELCDGGSQQVISHHKIAGLYDCISGQVGKFSTFEAQHGGVGTYQRPSETGLSLKKLVLVHDK